MGCQGRGAPLIFDSIEAAIAAAPPPPAHCLDGAGRNLCAALAVGVVVEPAPAASGAAVNCAVGPKGACAPASPPGRAKRVYQAIPKTYPVAEWHHCATPEDVPVACDAKGVEIVYLPHELTGPP